MTLEEALEIMGVCMVAICTKSPGYEPTSYYVFNAIFEEWMDGNMSSIDSEVIQEAIKKYDLNVFKQAARTIANKINMYGDVG